MIQVNNSRQNIKDISLNEIFPAFLIVTTSWNIKVKMSVPQREIIKKKKSSHKV